VGTAGYVPNFTCAPAQVLSPYRAVRIAGSAFTLSLAEDPVQVVLGVTDGSTRAFDSTQHAIAGGPVSLQNGRFVQVTAGAACAVGDLLKVTTAGKLVPAAGDRAFFQACESASADNEIIWAFRVQTWEI
jgi:hypothetical protein